MKPIGYLVMETCEDFEQALSLYFGKDLPSGGILGFTGIHLLSPPYLFASRANAVAAIDRTEHYRLAFNKLDAPQKKYCVIISVESSEVKS